MTSRITRSKDLSWHFASPRRAGQGLLDLESLVAEHGGDGVDDRRLVVDDEDPLWPRPPGNVHSSARHGFSLALAGRRSRIARPPGRCTPVAATACGRRRPVPGPAELQPDRARRCRGVSSRSGHRSKSRDPCGYRSRTSWRTGSSPTRTSSCRSRSWTSWSRSSPSGSPGRCSRTRPIALFGDRVVRRHRLVGRCRRSGRADAEADPGSDSSRAHRDGDKCVAPRM